MIPKRLETLLHLRIQFVPPSKQNPPRFMKTSNLMLLSELIAVFSEKKILNTQIRYVGWKSFFLLANLLLLPEVQTGEAW